MRQSGDCLRSHTHGNLAKEQSREVSSGVALRQRREPLRLERLIANHSKKPRDPYRCCYRRLLASRSWACRLTGKGWPSGATKPWRALPQHKPKRRSSKAAQYRTLPTPTGCNSLPDPRTPPGVLTTRKHPVRIRRSHHGHYGQNTTHSASRRESIKAFRHYA